MSDKIYPVYTLKSKCHDCYKCVRECFVKSIEITNSQAKIIKETCIACGHCVRVCPQGAKKIRYDINKVVSLIASGKKVVASLAPSFFGMYDYTEEEICAIFKSLGFMGVSETAHGAENVSIQTAKILNEAEHGLFISSACPVVVDYIRYYKPEFTPCITKLGSPLLFHAKLLKETLGSDVEVVFVGPCIAKKNEADNNPELLAAALTFEEFNFWLKENNIEKENIEITNDDKFILGKAHEGAHYPIEGGMNETIKLSNVDNTRLISTSSLANLKNALANLDPAKIKDKIFLEALSCEGGCVRGPAATVKKAGILVNSDILSKIQKRETIPKEPDTVCEKTYEPKTLDTKTFSLDEITKAMKSIGKTTEEDELNCGGCGYSTCRELVYAILEGKAEPTSCVSYMRKLAQRKTAMVLKSMPSGVVVVDNNLEIVETNEAFIKMFMSDMADVFTGENPLKGASLERIVPFSKLFETAINKNLEIHEERCKIGSKMYDIIIFIIEQNSIGAIITDITVNEVNREKVAKKAKEVINKNIETVQNIAGLLGEHMVEVETLLNSIAQDFSDGGGE